ncbi:DNA polymerase Y family protein [Herbiconiux sp. A18JL235]|uniref:DNA polymerase Y family protein n=1 Tax=Herbiconiux sp. A18JL235 TaxID=3152363 RepID=A0AB39BBL4_9MICO
MNALRTMVVWCPDWPVVATAAAHGLQPDERIAVIDKGLVYACSEAARNEGVRRGLRLREAQSRCTGLRDLPLDPVQINRAFEPFIAALEDMSPQVQVMRAGSCALRARGPRRFYDGEHPAALAFLERFAELGVTDARVGVADGLFAAEQAARLPGVDLIRIVPEGASPRFLAELPLHALHEEELQLLLWRLGIRTLGDFAALPAADVRARFGEPGARAHAKAGGADPRLVVPRVPPEVRESVSLFEPPLERIDQITFSIRAEADRFVDELAAARLVCTELVVHLETERGEVRERSWLHPRWFSASDVVDRVRWQLQGGSTIESVLSAPVNRVRLVAETVDDSSAHETGLWGSGSEERIHHGLSRVQSIVGHEGVLTATIGDGRSPRERQKLVPWGDSLAPRRPKDAAGAGRSVAARARSRAARGQTGVEQGEKPTWPGSLPPPLPTTVFEVRRQILLVTEDGVVIDIDDSGELLGEPARFAASASHRDLRPVVAWAGPWPMAERWWDAASARRVDRLQVVDAEGTAWLLALEHHLWWAEARYD